MDSRTHAPGAGNAYLGPPPEPDEEHPERCTPVHYGAKRHFPTEGRDDSNVIHHYADLSREYRKRSNIPGIQLGLGLGLGSRIP